MGCICTEPPKKPSDLDIMKDIGESEGKWSGTNARQLEPTGNISPNEQKPDKHSLEEKHSNEEVSFFERFSVDFEPESDLRRTFSSEPGTTSKMNDLTLLVEWEPCTLGEDRSTKLQWDRGVLTKLIESNKVNTAELTKARKDLERMQSRISEKDEEIHTLKAENYKLKGNTKSKPSTASQIAFKSLTLKERYYSMRKKREEIHKSAGMIHRSSQSIDDNEQANEFERNSSSQFSELNEKISPKKDPALHWRVTPRESRPPEEMETDSKWTYFEPIVLE